MTNIAIILPVYNESKRIDKCLKPLLKFISNLNHNFMIIIVDDGSTDDTLNYISNNYNVKNITLIKSNRNFGKGYAVRKGITEALSGNYQQIIFGDSDGSWSTDSLLNIITKLNEGNDVVIGTRNLNKINVPFYRKSISRVTRYFYRNIFDLNSINDTQAGLKGFTFNAAQQIFPLCEQNGWLFDIEILILARRKNMNIYQIPITWNHQEGSKINFRTVKKTFNDIPGLLKYINLYFIMKLVIFFIVIIYNIKK
jgi:glycosyltransferase involved in cell wall biosynthesis